MFGKERLTDSAFVCFLSKEVDVNTSNLRRSISKWFNGDMEETRGKWGLPTQVRQKIYDMWVENAIPSTDNRNNRGQVKIPKLEFLRRYKDIKHKNVELNEEVSKRRCKNIVGKRMIMTETVSALQKKLAEEELVVSIGSILNMKPFYIAYATEKEMSLCLCKICLNSKFLFDVLMVKAKKDGDDTFESLSSFFMYECSCPKDPNGYYQWSCVNK